MTDYNSTEQDILCSYLGNYLPTIKTAYLGATHALTVKDYPDRLVHFAHSLREVIDLLTRKNQTNEEKRKSLCRLDRIKLLTSVIDPAGKQAYEFGHLYKQLVDEYGELSTYAHHRSDLDQNDAEKKMETIEGILSHLTRPQIEIIDEIDEIISSEPSKKMAQQLKSFLFRWSSRSYLLEKLPCEWLIHLNEINFFDAPRPAHLSNKETSKPFPYWIPSGYLVKCVNLMPDLVTEIILKCKFKSPNERNPVVYDDFLKCALDLSNSNAEKIAQKAIDEKWHDFSNYSFIAEKYGDLTEKLYVAEKYEIAIKLLSNLFYSQKKNFANSYDYDLEKILTNNIPKLVEKNPTDIAKLLASFIEDILVSSHTVQELDSKPKDTSHNLLSAIEDHKQNHSHLRNPRALCVIQLRNSLVLLGDEDPTQLKANMCILSKKNFYIFRRIDLFLYSKFPILFKDKIVKSLKDYFGVYQVHHEYYNLLKNVFGKMTKSEKSHFLNFIEEKKQQKFSELKEMYGEEKAKTEQKLWLRNRLEPIREHLDDKHKKQYDELIKEYGTPHHPDFIQYVEMPIGKPAVEPDMFTDKTMDEVFEILKKHVPTSDIPPYEDKIIASFGDFVRKNPLECSKKSMDMVDADPKIQYEFLSNIESSVIAKKKIDWSCVLSLIENIADSAISDTSYHPWSFDPVLEACRIVEKGLTHNQIKYNLKDNIWKITTKVIEIGDKFPGDKEYDNKNTNSLNISINSIDGLSFHILCRYVVWCSDHEKTKNVFAKNIKQILESYVSRTLGHPTIARHAALGLFFPTFFYLDMDWTNQTILPNIFSSKSTKIAFWDSYVFNNAETPIMIKLHNMYNEFLNGKILSDVHDMDMYHTTIEHVTLGYLYSVENYDAIFKKFLIKADSHSINHCGFFIMRVLLDNPDISKFKGKIINMWREQKFIDYADLNIWFRNSPFDKKETMELFLNYMQNYTKKFNSVRFPLEELNEYVKDFPQEVVQCIQIFLDKLEDPYHLPTMLKSILEDLIAKNIDAVYARCKKIIEKLVEHGYNDYNELLKDNN